MASITAKTVDKLTEWEDFLAGHDEANFLQSWYWGLFHEHIGHSVIRQGFYQGDTLKGVMQAVVEPARRGRHLVIAGGPILDWQDSDAIQTWLTTIRQIAKEHQCLFVRVRPQLLDNADNRQLFSTMGFRKSPMHVTADLTSQLDLTKSDEDLKRSMRKGTRYELNRARKLDIKVETGIDQSYIDEFYNLQLKTAKRQNFVPFSRNFLSQQFITFGEANKALLYRSSYQGKLLAMAFVIFYGAEAAYHYGASTELARELPGAYAIQAAAIAEARRRGCLRYNLWGVTEHGQTKHRFYGVSVFKRGFGGEDVAYLPARDLVINRAKYQATYLFETARRKLRHL